MFNPFFYGDPVPPNQFIDRQKELQRITGRIVNRGQSAAVVGEPRSGKTSLLLYLAAPEKRTKLYGTDGESLVFSYLDAQTWDEQFSQAQFWEHALHPFHERAIAPNPDSSLAEAYQVSQENGFGCAVLERLFVQTKLAGWRFVLMLDEFDVLLYHPILNSNEFFGSLRSLASRSREALALVLASRHSLTTLEATAQEFSRAGSPYFNFLREITLGPLPAKDITRWLHRAESRFTRDDHQFIGRVAGGHPYLVQVAASALWEAYEDGEDDPNTRRQQAGQSLYAEAGRTLHDTWRIWSPATRQALTIVALAHIPKLLGQRELHVKRLVRDMRDLGPELEALKGKGLVTKDATIPSGWKVRPGVFLWWLADELVRSVRREIPLEEWLQEQVWEGLLTRGEKEQLGKVGCALTALLKDGVTTLIEAAAKGAIEVTLSGGWTGSTA